MADQATQSLDAPSTDARPITQRNGASWRTMQSNEPRLNDEVENALITMALHLETDAGTSEEVLAATDLVMDWASHRHAELPRHSFRRRVFVWLIVGPITLTLFFLPELLILFR